MIYSEIAFSPNIRLMGSKGWSVDLFLFLYTHTHSNHFNCFSVYQKTRRINYHIFWHSRWMVYKCIQGIIAYCNPSKLHSYLFQTSVDNSSHHNAVIYWHRITLKLKVSCMPSNILIDIKLDLKFKYHD